VIESLLVRLGELQLRRPWWVILLVFSTLLPAGRAASKLTLRTSFTELLPDSKPSVVEMRRVSERLPGNATLTLVAEGEKTEALETFVDHVVPKILALGPNLVVGVDDGPRRLQQFFRDHEGLYASLDDLTSMHDEIVESYDAQVSKASGFDLGLDDEPTKKIDVDEIVGKLDKKSEQAKKDSPGRDGYYVSKDGHTAAVLVRTPFASGDQRAFELEDRVNQIVKELNPAQWDPSMHFGFTGNLVTSAEQHRTITKDLTDVGTWGVGFILTVVFLFFLQFRTLLAMALTITVGCVWAFGTAYYTVGYLNTATGFLTSIIAGNGINFGIIYMARYVEARREEGLAVPEAVLTAHRGTWAATLSAAIAAGTAYGSLSMTDFRGFKHFGIIGGIGMVLCWVATYALLPAVLVVSERLSPMYASGANWRSRFSGLYGRPFAWLVARAPRPIAVVSVALGVLGAIAAYRYFSHDPMEYDLRNIRNQDTPNQPARLLSLKVDKIVGRAGQDGRAIVVDRLDQVKPLTTELLARRDHAPADNKPFSKVVSIFDLVPDHQDEKIALLADIKKRVVRAHQRHFISDADWKRLEPHIPESLAPIGIADLPEQLARPFQEKNGTRGTVVYIVPTEGKSVYDAHYLMHWADSFREVRLPNGDVIRGSGDPVIFSDMLIAVGEEAPKAVLGSFLGTLVVMLIAFRGRRAAFITLATLALGLSWLILFLAVDHVKLNFLNFVALPISIGVGADYALNMMTRREMHPDESIPHVVIETGGAVILCSLTTMLGYFALMLSINQAVRSFGLAAAMGEVTTILAAVLALPALLIVAGAKRRAP
jgi:hypothetical protein